MSTTTTAFVIAYFLTGLPITAYRHTLYIRSLFHTGENTVHDFLVAVCLFPARLLFWPALEIAALSEPNQE